MMPVEFLQKSYMSANQVELANINADLEECQLEIAKIDRDIQTHYASDAINIQGLSRCKRSSSGFDSNAKRRN